MPNTTMSNSYEAIYAVVRRIPSGRVCSYGQIALLAGYPGQARLVGYALHRLQGGTDVPWWRVLNRLGVISNAYEPELQRTLLEREGVVVNEHLQVDLKQFRWIALQPPT